MTYQITTRRTAEGNACCFAAWSGEAEDADEAVATYAAENGWTVGEEADGLYPLTSGAVTVHVSVEALAG